MMSRISSIKRETAQVEDKDAIKPDDFINVDLAEVLLLTLPHLDTILFYTIRMCCF